MSPVTYSYWLVHVPAKNDCHRYQRTMHATLPWRKSDRRMYGSPFVWPSPSTDDSKLFYGLTYLAQHVIAWSDALSFDLLALGLVSITNIY
ncbi:hypothetical protein P692DRAFT_201354591 [Suillus brevipes Sb2]|nr:hypothetical protein P692DRAFT_201354591 [Suillus brevipes Sb2]